MRPTLSYFICSTPRTGSSLLQDALYDTRIAGKPREYFDEHYEQLWIDRLGITSDADYVEKVRDLTTPNGVFGLKIFWFQLEFLVAKLSRIHGRAEPDFDLLDQEFPNLRFIFLTREDKVRQAISWVKAHQTQMWWSIPEAPGNRTTPQEEPTFDFAELDLRVRFLTELDSTWLAYFEKRGVEPLRIEYEEFIRSYEPTVFSVLRYLGLSLPEGMSLPKPRMQKQSDEINEEWFRRYHEIKKAEATAPARTSNEAGNR
jgi:LPS sulfotransferase NodH